MTNDRTAIARLLEYWLECAGKEDGFGNRVKITDMVTHEAVDAVKRGNLTHAFSASKSCCCELDAPARPRLRVIQGGRQ
jgi:hypothetical protein